MKVSESPESKVCKTAQSQDAAESRQKMRHHRVNARCIGNTTELILNMEDKHLRVNVKSVGKAIDLKL